MRRLLPIISPLLVSLLICSLAGAPQNDAPGHILEAEEAAGDWLTGPVRER